MEDEVVNLEVAVNQSRPVGWLLPDIGEVLHHLFKEGQLADSLARIDILDLGLRSADGLPGLNLTVVEAMGFAELL